MKQFHQCIPHMYDVFMLKKQGAPDKTGINDGSVMVYS